MSVFLGANLLRLIKVGLDSIGDQGLPSGDGLLKAFHRFIAPCELDGQRLLALAYRGFLLNRAEVQVCLYQELLKLISLLLGQALRTHFE
eukprot:4385779-Amphidinium_carterae.1